MLVPLILTDEEIDTLQSQLEVQPQVEPSKTYKFDFDLGEVYAEFIDDNEALKQSIIKSIKTIREKYIIYSSDYGSEIFYLFGQGYSLEYLEIEVPRLIKETLIIDDRIEDCDNFVIEQDSDSLYVTFDTITANQTSLTVEVSL